MTTKEAVILQGHGDTDGLVLFTGTADECEALSSALVEKIGTVLSEFPGAANSVAISPVALTTVVEPGAAVQQDSARYAPVPPVLPAP